MNDLGEPYNEAFEPVRGRVNIDINALVQREEAVYRIVEILDFESIIGIDVQTGRSVPLRIGELRNVSNVETASSSETPQDLADIADEDWRVAQQRYAAINPLVGKLHIGRDEAEQRAKEVGIDTATLYRWLKRFNAYGSVTALIPMKRGWKEGNSRISKEADDIIHQVIRDYYLTP